MGEETITPFIVFYVGLHIALRGVQEQYDLVPQQFAQFPPDVTRYDCTVYYEYTEFVSNIDSRMLIKAAVCIHCWGRNVVL